MMKRLVEQGGYKRSDAVSGFEAAGLYPLCREKINDTKIAAGSIFREEVESPSTPNTSSLTLKANTNSLTPNLLFLFN